MIDNDGNLTASGTFTIMALVMAPVLLGIALLKLFFRAPLAAIVGSAFFVGLSWIGVQINAAATVGMNPVAGLLVTGLILCVGAGVCYALMSAGWMQRFFAWECSILSTALSHGGIFGRIFYTLAQVIPGLLLAIFILAVMFGPQPTQPTTQLDTILFWIIVGWLAISQFVVYRFHRTEHPVGSQVSFMGIPLLTGDSVDEPE